MLETVFNWLKFEPQNLIFEVWVCCGVLWAVLLVIGLADIATSHLRLLGKLFWMAFILLAPFLGLFAYCIYCLIKADYYMVDFLFRKRKSSPPKGLTPN